MDHDILGTMSRREAIDMAAEEWRDRRDLRLIVTSRRVAQHRVNTAEEPCSVISVSDPLPVSEPLRFQPAFYLRDVLPLSFCDLDPVRRAEADYSVFDDDYGRCWNELFMTPDHGHAIWEFLATCSEKLLIVHCYAGVSRSPSIAMAICDALHIPRSSITWGEDLDPTIDPPNQHVYDCVRTAFFKWKRQSAADRTNPALDSTPPVLAAP